MTYQRAGTLRNIFRWRGCRNEFGRGLIGEQDPCRALSILGDPHTTGIIELAWFAHLRSDISAPWQAHTGAFGRPAFLDLGEHRGQLADTPSGRACIDQGGIDDPEVATASNR